MNELTPDNRGKRTGVDNDSGLAPRPKLIIPIRRGTNFRIDENGNWISCDGSSPVNNDLSLKAIGLNQDGLKFLSQGSIPGSNERPQSFKKSLDIDIDKEGESHQ